MRTANGHRPGRGARVAPWAVLAWLVAWQAAATALGSDILLPGPVAVAAALLRLVPSPSFWHRVLFSLMRIAVGFALGGALGCVGAFLASRSRAAEQLFSPIIALAKSVPVASIAVLALIWLRAANLAVLVVLLVVLPVAYGNALEGLRAADRALSEAGELFRLRPARRLRFLVMPALFPYLRAALVLGMGTAWKAGVAAEVIGIPTGSLGEAVYDAKIYFDTPSLFAVTLVIVLASAASTALLRRLLVALEPVACGAAGAAPAYEDVDEDIASGGLDGLADAKDQPHAQGRDGRCLRVEGVAKRFGEENVISSCTLEVRAGDPVCLMAPSGAGKTTLLRIIAGIERADAGTVHLVDTDGTVCGTARASMSFQDDRLADQASALANVRLPLAAGSDSWVAAPRVLRALGLGSRLLAPAGTCSGGERRRIGLARALCAPHDVLILDEPFNGLDAAARERAGDLIRERERHAIVLMASHDERDAALIGARIVNL